jgi:hypothetical protein
LARISKLFEFKFALIWKICSKQKTQKEKRVNQANRKIKTKIKRKSEKRKRGKKKKEKRKRENRHKKFRENLPNHKITEEKLISRKPS